MNLAKADMVVERGATALEAWARDLAVDGGVKRQLAEELVRGFVEEPFDRLDPKTRSRVRRADTERLLDWGKRVLAAERLEDVFRS